MHLLEPRRRYRSEHRPLCRKPSKTINVRCATNAVHTSQRPRSPPSAVRCTAHTVLSGTERSTRCTLCFGVDFLRRHRSWPSALCVCSCRLCWRYVHELCVPAPLEHRCDADARFGAEARGQLRDRARREIEPADVAQPREVRDRRAVERCSNKCGLGCNQTAVVRTLDNEYVASD